MHARWPPAGTHWVLQMPLSQATHLLSLSEVMSLQKNVYYVSAFKNA